MPVRKLAVLSMHTSPLVQPGVGDGGGMNVYVRELVSSLAQAGVESDVYVRAWRPALPEVVEVEPGFRVVHVPVGPPDMLKEDLEEVVDEYASWVASHLVPAEVDAIHANYWLSGLAGHHLKHRLDLPLVSTFHTLARVKAEGGDQEHDRRARAELEIIHCSDAVLASCQAEVDQLVDLYDAPRSRIEVVPPGVDHAFFSPGDRRGARGALGLGDGNVVLFVGRIQPLKGLATAVAAFSELQDPTATLVVVGGPSGPEGEAELRRARRRAEDLGIARQIRFSPPQPHHLLSTYYRAADVSLVTSRSESFGLVALEAAACGTPVVASAVGGLTTLVEHERTGLLVDEHDPASFASALGRVLADPTWAAELGAEGARQAKRYRWSTAAARLRRVYSDVARHAPVSCN